MRMKLLITVVLLAASLVFAADYRFTDAASGDHSWGSSANWNPAGPPASADIAYFNEDYGITGNYCEISEGDNITIARIRMSESDSGKDTYIKMTGGTLNVTSGVDLGYYHFYDDSFVACTFEQLGGDVVIGDFWRIAYRTGKSEWYLRDGTVTCGRLLLNADPATYSRIIIENGSFSVKYDRVSELSALFGTTILPYNGEGMLTATYDPTARGGIGETVVKRVARSGSPNPASGAVDVASDVTLSWVAGPGSVSSNVYFGTDYQAVIEADPGDPEYVANQTAATYSLSDLTYGQTYYWRIDAVAADDSIVRGFTWNFTVTESVLIEDFESYTNDADIQAVWGGSAALDLATIYNSTQALDLFFEHTLEAQTTSVSRVFSPAMDWDKPGLMALAMDVYGDANEIDTLYLSVSDGSNQAVAYYPDVTELYADFNQEYRGWNIALSDLAAQGLDLSNVVSMEIGFSGVGRGTVLFDNIALHIARCVPSFFPGDITGDCTADMDDLQFYIADWLDESGVITAGTAPTDQLLYYTFDETSGYTANDSSGNGFDGMTTDLAAHWLPTGGVNGGCLELTGSMGVSLPLEVFDSNDITETITIAFWINGDDTVYPSQERYDFTFLAEHNNGDRVVIILPYKNGNVFWRTHNADGINETVTWIDSVPSDWAGQWNHYAVTKDVNSGLMEMFRNGELVARSYDNTTAIANSGPVTESFIGCLNANGSYAHIGKMDEFMIFDRILSQEEILALADQTQVAQPVVSPADINEDDIVNLEDYALTASQWLNEQTTWPVAF